MEIQTNLLTKRSRSVDYWYGMYRYRYTMYVPVTVPPGSMLTCAILMCAQLRHHSNAIYESNVLVCCRVCFTSLDYV